MFILINFCRYEPLSPLLGNEYFFHAYGPIYILSADVVASLVALKNDRQVYFSKASNLLWTSSVHFVL